MKKLQILNFKYRKKDKEKKMKMDHNQEIDEL